jgi:hypothetical protein
VIKMRLIARLNCLKNLRGTFTLTYLAQTRRSVARASVTPFRKFSRGTDMINKCSQMGTSRRSRILPISLDQGTGRATGKMTEMSASQMLNYLIQNLNSQIESKCREICLKIYQSNLLDIIL